MDVEPKYSRSRAGAIPSNTPRWFRQQHHPASGSIKTCSNKHNIAKNIRGRYKLFTE
ncbi:uncharacterized protein DS421_7g213790 [Arachis hypogaea]|nr:uncharacterized protein DS421_7g213790 [Arachis hypogaea]